MDRLPLRVYPVHGCDSVVDAEESDILCGGRGKDGACELPCERRAATEAEHDDSVVWRGIEPFQVIHGLGHDAARVPPARRERAVDESPGLGDEITDERDGFSVLARSDPVVVAGLLGISADRQCITPVLIESATHEDVQLEDVADALVLLEAGSVLGLISRAIEAEHECSCFGDFHV